MAMSYFFFYLLGMRQTKNIIYLGGIVLREHNVFVFDVFYALKLLNYFFSLKPFN